MGLVRSSALAVLGFALAAAAVNSTFMALSPGRFPALAKIKEATDDPRINAVFFGTSRIEHGVRPDVFDAAMRRHGINDVRSFNAAQFDSGVLESFAAIERLLDLRPHGIRYVLLEPDFTAQGIIRAPDTLRAIDFFGLRNALRSIQYMDFPGRRPAPELPMLTRARNVASATFRHYFNVGFFWTAPQVLTDYSPGSRGYPDLDYHVHSQYRPDDTYKVQLEDIAAAPPNPDLISDNQIKMVLSISELIKSRGAVPILIAPPQLAHWAFSAAFAARYRQRCAGTGPLLLDFRPPADNAILYAAENRMDDDHFNEVGAALFSSRIAERLAAEGSSEAPICTLLPGDPVAMASPDRGAPLEPAPPSPRAPAPAP